jgi:hypothetical protein
MELKDGRITFLVDEGGARIEIRDSSASVMFVAVDMNCSQLCQALGRLAHTKCKVSVHNLDLVGKKMEWKKFEFSMAGLNSYGKERKAEAIRRVTAECPKGWEPDLQFNSQSSFFRRGEEPMARTTIRRWV